MEIVKENAPEGWDVRIMIRPSNVPRQNWQALLVGTTTRSKLDDFLEMDLTEKQAIYESLYMLLDGIVYSQREDGNQHGYSELDMKAEQEGM